MSHSKPIPTADLRRNTINVLFQWCLQTPCLGARTFSAIRLCLSSNLESALRARKLQRDQCQYDCYLRHPKAQTEGKQQADKPKCTPHPDHSEISFTHKGWVFRSRLVWLRHRRHDPVLVIPARRNSNECAGGYVKLGRGGEGRFAMTRRNGYSLHRSLHLLPHYSARLTASRKSFRGHSCHIFSWFVMWLKGGRTPRSNMKHHLQHTRSCTRDSTSAVFVAISPRTTPRLDSTRFALGSSYRAWENKTGSPLPRVHEAHRNGNNRTEDTLKGMHEAIRSSVRQGHA